MSLPAPTPVEQTLVELILVEARLLIAHCQEPEDCIHPEKACIDCLASSSSRLRAAFTALDHERRIHAPVLEGTLP